LEGNDVIAGGDDDDLVYGDGISNLLWLLNGVPNTDHGDDILDGGAGNDTLLAALSSAARFRQGANDAVFLIASAA